MSLRCIFSKRESFPGGKTNQIFRRLRRADRFANTILCITLHTYIACKHAKISGSLLILVSAIALRVYIIHKLLDLQRIVLAIVLHGYVIRKTHRKCRRQLTKKTEEPSANLPLDLSTHYEIVDTRNQSMTK